MKTIEKIIVGSLLGVGLIGTSLLAQKCSGSIMEAWHNLIPLNSQFNYEKAVMETNETEETREIMNGYYSPKNYSPSN